MLTNLTGRHNRTNNDLYSYCWHTGAQVHCFFCRGQDSMTLTDSHTNGIQIEAHDLRLYALLHVQPNVHRIQRRWCGRNVKVNTPPPKPASVVLRRMDKVTLHPFLIGWTSHTAETLTAAQRFKKHPPLEESKRSLPYTQQSDYESKQWTLIFFLFHLAISFHNIFEGLHGFLYFTIDVLIWSWEAKTVK